MKQTGIIMSGNHPKLILDRIKTQTRRLAKLHKFNEHPDKWRIRTGVNCWFADSIELNKYNLPSQQIYIKCPYGQVGDLMWVRETHFIGGIKPKEWVWYKAGFDGNAEAVGWRPSIHMFRWASRITLEITEVRVERVQEIDSWDCIYEGIKQKELFHPHGLMIDKPNAHLIEEYHYLWDSLNAKRGFGWEANPWVWVMSFKVVNNG